MLPLCTKSIHHFVNSESCGAVQEFMRIPSSKVERQNLPFRGKSMDLLWFSTSMTQGLQRTDAPRAALLAYTWQAAVVGLVASPGSWRFSGSMLGRWSLEQLEVYLLQSRINFFFVTELCVCDKVVCVWELCVTELCERVVCERGRRADGSGRECTTEKQEPHTKIWGKKCPMISAFGDCLDIWKTISSNESCWSALISHQNCKQKNVCLSP